MPLLVAGAAALTATALVPGAMSTRKNTGVCSPIRLGSEAAKGVEGVRWPDSTYQCSLNDGSKSVIEMNKTLNALKERDFNQRRGAIDSLSRQGFEMIKCCDQGQLKTLTSNIYTTIKELSTSLPGNYPLKSLGPEAIHYLKPLLINIIKSDPSLADEVIKFLDTQIEINKYSSTTTDKTMYKGLNHQLTDIVNGLNKIKLV